MSRCQMFRLQGNGVTYSRPYDHLLKIEGNARIYTNKTDVAAFADLGMAQDQKLFSYMWLDRHGGSAAEMHFKNGDGSFELEVPVQTSVKDLLKNQVQWYNEDDTTHNHRSITFGVGACVLPELMGTGSSDYLVRDSVNPNNYARVSLRLKNAGEFRNHKENAAREDLPLISFTPSALWNIKKSNEIMESISKELREKVQRNKITVAGPASAFLEGITRWEFGGVWKADGTCLVPALSTHYSIMDLQEHLQSRVLPIAVVAYMLYLRILHSGLSIESIVKMEKPAVGQFLSEGMHFTWDSTIYKYNRDYTMAVVMSFFGGFGLQAVGTEDMAMPCSAPQYLGKKLFPFNPVIPPAGANLGQILGLMKGRPSFSASVCTDDCETTTLLGQLARATTQDFYRRKGNLQQECQGYPMFQKWNNNDFDKMQGVLMVSGEMLESKALSVTNTVGLACAAAAGQEPTPDSYNGHCFNVGRYIDIDTGKINCFILEGTAAMEQMKVTDTTPRVSAMVRGMIPGDEKSWNNVTMDMPKFLTMFGKTVAVLSQICNDPKGGYSSEGGVKAGERLAGWVSSKEVINSLDSDSKYPMPFYNRIVYMGWQCTQNGVGCMPVEETPGALADALDDAPLLPGSARPGQRMIGIPPHGLSDSGLRGLDVSLSPEQTKIMGDAFEECQPPMASPDVFKHLSAFWQPCESLSAQTVIPYGEENKWVIASCMESPASPDYIYLNHEAKRILFAEANRLNKLRADSDGIEAHVFLSGTGTLVQLKVPNQDIKKLTYVECLLQAMKNVNWPGVATVSKPSP